MSKRTILPLILCLVMLIVSCNVFHAPQHVRENEKTYKVFILWSGLGEYAWAKRLENACEQMGWQCTLCCSSQQQDQFDRLVIDKTLEPPAIKAIIEQANPDFVISLKDDHIFSNKFPNYLTVNGGIGHYFDPYFQPSPKYLSFDGFLYSSKAINKFKAFYETSGKKFHGIEWYASCAATNYEPVVPKRVFFCGFQWDQKRNGPEFRKMFKLLDEQGHLDIYGPADRWDFVPNAVKGFTFDAKEFQQGIREAGIVLVINSEFNMIMNTPAARIFEAAAAGAVIISDRLPFTMDNFGDSVFYVDQNKNGEELYREINAHLEWILAHPKEAEEMARKSHTLFLEKFTLENQLRNLAKMHEELQANKLIK